MLQEENLCQPGADHVNSLISSEDNNFTLETNVLKLAEDDLPCSWQLCAPKVFQRFRTTQCALLWLSIATMLQTLSSVGFFGSTLSTIERRYGLSSQHSGLIAAFNDIGVCLALLPVSYWGGKGRKSHWIAGGIFIGGLSTLLYAVPHFFSSNYVYSSVLSTTHLCSKDGKQDNMSQWCNNNKILSSSSNSENNLVYIFYAAQLLSGAGFSSLFVLAVNYLDDNLSINDSAVYMSIYVIVSMLGPAIGFVLSGLILRIFVDISADRSSLMKEDTSGWVGAWWLGFVICGLLLCVSAIPIYGFPKYIPGTRSIRKNKRKEAYETHSSLENGVPILKNLDILSSLKILLLNPSFILLCIGGSLDTFTLSIFSVFGAKLIENLFGVSVSRASVLMGCLIATAGLAGVLFGGLIIKYSRLTLRKLLFLIVLLAALNCGFFFAWCMRCTSTLFEGIRLNESDYLQRSPCNAQCGCVEHRAHLSPMCAQNKLYFSPCFAGCLNQTRVGDTFYYKSCSCIDSLNNTEFQGISGSCETSDCPTFPLFVALLVGLTFFNFSFTTPSCSALLRCVPEEQRSLGLGISSLAGRCLGSIPGPIIIGKLLDKSCLLWTKNCDGRGSCEQYDPARMQFAVVASCTIANVGAVICFLLAAYYYKEPSSKK